MRAELLIEILSLLVYTVAAIALTAAGIVTEYASIQHLGSGETMVAVWLAALGGVMLYAGVYGLGYQKLLARLMQY
ncbi:hypothetical protein [Halostagnicola sp. A-GB9-2]|uniref:hypothetical protein n=1 Tax=Halostagnicola sp. A-GB9-2 TaxID=3048066 RepID=UPI0024BFEF09|nr:hypothetical protein [Halostagnicola sp. A-GB9-2]MDJ1432858.1 hypothetical protein [Halostagnicola sp. A-GB9-2]